MSHREKLPTTRDAITHRFEVAGYKGWLIVGLYSDGRPGELFVVISKEGSTVSGLLDGWAQSVSFGLQYGVPLEKYVEHLKGTNFEPAGRTNNPDIQEATSLFDYIARWLEKKFINKAEEAPVARAS